MTVELDKLTAELAPEVAEKLLQSARRGGSEADFRREASQIFEEAGNKAGLTIVPRDEFTVARGRVDSVYNRLVLEYKRPGVLKESKSAKSNQSVIQQVKDYILDVAKKERREAQRLAGVAIDGHYFIFVRRVGEGWSVDEPLPVNKSTVERFLRLLFSLSSGAALVPENLIEDFGPKQRIAQVAVRALYRGFSSTKHPLVNNLFKQWRHFFSEATDYKEWSERIESKPEFRSFVASLWTKDEIKHLDPARVFFVLHTYYALLIKLVASLAAARFAGGTVAPLAQLAAREGDDLKDAFQYIEDGGLFRDYGIHNFLEGDFFGWYLPAWNKDIEDAVSGLIKRLAEYDPGTLELAPENARDLLKKLYHYLLPREIRHDLGEYYTPDWLAERLIIQTLGQADLGDPTKRVLDPSCGSGTFLVILIKYIKERAERKKMEPSKVLELILQNIVGIDLNPLAVIAARTNYLLALGDLLKARKGDINIPVYQADSILWPQRENEADKKGQFTLLYKGDVYTLRTQVGEFNVPSSFAERERMDTLANVLDESVKAGVGEEAFLVNLSKAAKLDPEEFEAWKEHLGKLYGRLRELHEQGLNGVWARIIKNAFAPLFLEPCHYVVGNPPWVNWESLPEEYRIQTKPLWEYYGLFPHGGMDTILGKGKKDISMLMTYVSVDRYLRRGGKLGFILSQSLFKTSGAGQGFRRFELPDKATFGPIVVEDMVALKPFEGATNRTAVAVFAKGHPVKYPISYQLWKKKETGRAGTIGFNTPYEEVTKEKITFNALSAEPIDEKDKTSSWITGRQKALKAIKNILGNSPYEAHEGSNTGGANGIYWVEIVSTRPGGLSIVANITERIKRKVPNVQAAVENDLLYPLLRGRDIKKWEANPSLNILMMQDPNTRRGIATDIVKKEYPKAYSYLSGFEKILRSRSAFRRYYRESDPYWSMFNVSLFTFSKWKVVWREQASGFTSAVIGPQKKKPVIPDHKLMLVEVSSKAEAHYLCGALNSSPARFAIISYVINIAMNTHILNNIAIPKFSRKNKTHVQLSKLSESAHKAAARGNTVEVERIEEEIDKAAAKLWGLTNQELEEIKRSLEEM